MNKNSTWVNVMEVVEHFEKTKHKNSKKKNCRH